MPRPANFEDAYPLSPLQQGLLFHTLSAPEEGLYLDQVSFLLEAAPGFAPERLRRAFGEVVARHGALRTAFTWKRRDMPMQVVLRSVSLPFAEHDWRGLSPAAERERLAAFLAEDRRRGFDLSAAPLLRVALCRLSERSYRLILTYHHIAFDGWSLALVQRELFARCAAPAEGPAPALAPARPYRDYIDWLRRQDLARAEEFWRRELAGFAAPTPLTVDRPPWGLSGSAALYASRTAWLAPTATAELGAFSRRHQVTLNSLVRGAWGLLLARYSGDDDLVFGATVSGRPDDLPGVESMVGMFINTLPVRLRVPPGRDLLAWLREIQRHQLDLRQFEYSPLVEVHGWSEVPRDTGLFDSLLVVENIALGEGAAGGPDGGFALREIAYEPKSSYPLTALATPGPRLALRVLYPGDRFDDATMVRLLGHFERLLAALPESAGRSLGELALLSPAERQQLLVEWQGAAQAVPRHLAIHQLFEQQVRRSPQVVAVTWPDGEWSYAELNERANRLAHHLRALGVGPGSWVGTLLDRSGAMVEALLGILKAGGAYVPIEPRFPAARRAAILGTLGVPVVVTTSAHLPALRRLEPDLPCLEHLVCLDDLEEADDGEGAGRALRWGRSHLDGQSAADPLCATGPDDIAYAIFTSGSTGLPKGVVVRHQAVVNLIAWVNETFGVGPGDRLLFVASLAFDLSVYDVFGILAAGGSIRVAMDGELAEPASLAAVLLFEPITLWDSAPAALAQLVAFLPPAAEAVVPAALRLVFLSGDWVPLSLPPQLQESFPDCRVVALGGATEATVWSNSFPVAEVDPRWVSIPYGRPMPNARYLVLDALLRPCPIGVPGDLYIGGECLASSYAALPAATAERFLPDPFAVASGARLYHTGDRARAWPDGTLEFLGRLDQQVKIRGFRIEAGEVEAGLLRHPAVRQAVVVAREDEPGDKRLVAYVVLAAEAPAAELLRCLAEVVPDYMLPAAVVALPALPVTANGKLDRRALPAPRPAHAAAAPGPPAARSPVEELLAGLWSEVLGIERVERQDNFFDLGGHSLRATQLASRIRTALGLELPLRSLIDAPTLRHLAATVEAALQQGVRVPPIARVEHGGEVAATFSQQRIWLLEQLAAGNPAYAISAALRLQGELDVAALDAGLCAVVRRQESLRTTFRAVDGRAVQVVGPPWRPPLPLIDLGGLDAARREESAWGWIEEAVRAPFDLGRGPLLRARLLRLEPALHLLVVVMHHVVSDAWSLGILVEEVARHYTAPASGQPPPPPPRYQYADYAEWQRQWLQGEALAGQLAYWRRQLAGAPATLELPSARLRPAVPSFRGAMVQRVLGAPGTAELRELSRKEGVTLFMTLAAVWKAVLFTFTAETDLVVGTNIANRHRGEFEDVIGCFVNTLALRTDLSGDPSFRELLGRVREVALGAYAHQDVPFEKVLEELRPERQLDHAPLFQVMLVHQDVPLTPVTRFPALKVTPLDHDRRAAGFDLTLYLRTDSAHLQAGVEYSTDLYEGESMTRLLDCFESFLRRICADPGVRLSDLRVADPAAARKVLEGFGGALEEE